MSLDRGASPRRLSEELAPRFHRCRRRTIAAADFQNTKTADPQPVGTGGAASRTRTRSVVKIAQGDGLGNLTGMSIVEARVVQGRADDGKCLDPERPKAIADPSKSCDRASAERTKDPAVHAKDQRSLSAIISE